MGTNILAGTKKESILEAYKKSFTKKGKKISGLETESESVVFHAGTTRSNGDVLTNGGRVLSITSYAGDFKKALQKSYDLAEKLDFEKKYYRKDLGFDL